MSVKSYACISISGLLIRIVKFSYSIQFLQMLLHGFKFPFAIFFSSKLIPQWSHAVESMLSPSVVSREWSVVGAAATSNSGPLQLALGAEAQLRRLMRGLTSWDFLRANICVSAVLLLLHFLNQVDAVGILGSMGIRVAVNRCTIPPVLKRFSCFLWKYKTVTSGTFESNDLSCEQRKICLNRTCSPASHFGEWAPKDSKTLTSYHSCWGASGQNFRMISIV